MTSTQKRDLAIASIQKGIHAPLAGADMTPCVDMTQSRD